MYYFHWFKINIAVIHYLCYIFIIEVPELPGCMADGATVEETIKKSELIIKEWIEVAVERGIEVPEPKGRLMYAWP